MQCMSWCRFSQSNHQDPILAGQKRQASGMVVGSVQRASVKRQMHQSIKLLCLEQTQINPVLSTAPTELSIQPFWSHQPDYIELAMHFCATSCSFILQLRALLIATTVRTIHSLRYCPSLIKPHYFSNLPLVTHALKLESSRCYDPFVSQTKISR